MSAPVAVTLKSVADYQEWRATARALLGRGVEPADVGFSHACATGDLFGGCEGDALQRGSLTADATPAASVRVPKDFPTLAKRVLCHRDEARFAVLYRLLWRLQATPRLLENAADPDVWAARRMGKAVQRDIHKMRAFVRFRRIESAAPEASQDTYVAWFEPEHHIIEATAPFFTRRFTGMRWSIVTPERSAHWDGTSLRFAPGASARDCPNGDTLETYWRVYYANIFNPARLKLDAMRAEMPVRYWRNLPESRLITELVSGARRAPPAGTATSIEAARRCVAAQRGNEPVAALPENLQSLGQALQACERCELCHTGTAPVPGEGPPVARLMIVGEQPGDKEDLAGRPFVGPAGQVLDEALEKAGIERESVYLTNAVKHFKHVLRGKRRIHQKPNAQEIEQCRWWLDIERQLVAPGVTVALGATAARAVLGRTIRVNEVRGTAWTDDTGGTAFVTVHPAYLLRLPDRQAAARERERFVEDLRRASVQAGLSP